MPWAAPFFTSNSHYLGILFSTPCGTEGIPTMWKPGFIISSHGIMTRKPGAISTPTALFPPAKAFWVTTCSLTAATTPSTGPTLPGRVGCSILSKVTHAEPCGFIHLDGGQIDGTAATWDLGDTDYGKYKPGYYNPPTIYFALEE